MGFLLLLFALPAIQARFLFVKKVALSGYAEPTPQPVLDWAGLGSNTYQPALEKHIDESIGFREFLIRLRNQIAYSVFNVSKANAVLVGKNEVLLDEVAIRAYHGQVSWVRRK